MRELEPVGERRVFVPETGDALMFCGTCGAEQGMLSGDTDFAISEMADISSACCAAERIVRRV